jgi:hypothetical protein
MVRLQIRVAPYYKDPRTMAIKLRVISDQYRELGELRSRVFGVNGGSIGRAPDNDWVLPDLKRLVSGHHCDIEYRSGEYWLRDRSTNGVFVNEADDPVSDTGPVALQDGDRLRMGDYEILVSLDDRIDFLPADAELRSAEKHLGADIGAKLDLDSLFSPRDTGDSSSISIRNAFGLKLPRDFREAAAAADRETQAQPAEPPPPPVRHATPSPSPVEAASTPETPGAWSAPAEWALRTNAVSRQELADALARRQRRIESRGQTLPFHQQAAAWEDLKSAVHAFCRGAGLDPSTPTCSRLVAPLHSSRHPTRRRSRRATRCALRAAWRKRSCACSSRTAARSADPWRRCATCCSMPRSTRPPSRRAFAPGSRRCSASLPRPTSRTSSNRGARERWPRGRTRARNTGSITRSCIAS